MSMPSSDCNQSAVRLVVGLLRPHRIRIAFALFLTVLACLLTLPLPLLVQSLIDGALSGTTLSLSLLGGLLLAALVLQAGCGMAAALLIGEAAIDAARTLRRQVYQRLLHDEVNSSPGVALSRLTDDVACVQGLVSVQTIGLATDLGTAAVVAGYLLWQSPLLFAAAALFVPLTVAHFRYFTRRIRHGSLEVRQRLDRIFVQLKEKLDGALVVKAHGREAMEEADFAAKMAGAHEPRLNLGRLTIGLSFGSQLLGGLGATAVFAVGVAGVLQGSLTPGQAVSAIALTALLFGPISRLADVAASVEQAAASCRRLGELTAWSKRAVTEPIDPTPLGRARGMLEFEGVGFAYQPGHPVLMDVSWHAEPGEHIAVVGPTGCGKTTLLGLLLRFHDPDWGDVRIDGIPLRRLSLSDVRRQFGLVPQDPIVFRGTLADNIRYGCPEASWDRVHAAAAAAGIEALANRLPHGFATVIGEGGHLLSAGERQRIAIARALCLDPPIVLLDEATSHLDPVAESEVQTALTRLLQGRTAIIVAHRLATVRNVDRIIALDGGRIVRSGAPADVLDESSLQS
jgi:ABC-type multidrug transport system fused ATPase/permease subunit